MSLYLFIQCCLALTLVGSQCVGHSRYKQPNRPHPKHTKKCWGMIFNCISFSRLQPNSRILSLVTGPIYEFCSLPVGPTCSQTFNKCPKYGIDACLINQVAINVGLHREGDINCSSHIFQNARLFICLLIVCFYHITAIGSF